jgi:hypothetical protein
MRFSLRLLSAVFAQSFHCLPLRKPTNVVRVFLPFKDAEPLSLPGLEKRRNHEMTEFHVGEHFEHATAYGFRGLGATAAVLGLLSVAQTQSVANFYKGKNVELLIGYSSGGAYDVYARLLARHMGKHIPGNPTIIPRNMPGAGSVVLANWLYNIAPRDGTVIGTIGRGTPFDPIFAFGSPKFDPTKYLWLGSMNNEVSVCVSWHTSGFTRFEHLLQKELVVGGAGASGDTEQFPRIANAVLGTKFRIVSGYPRDNDINLALERGEVSGRCGWSCQPWSQRVWTG